jgi:hypothetical protein
MSSENRHSSGLPEEFQRYFWDVAFDDLTIEKYPQFIVERILNYGDLDGIKWLLSWADKEYIRTIVEKSRNLNSKTINYWQIILADINN